MKYFLLSAVLSIIDLVSKKSVKGKITLGKKKKIKGKLYLWHIKNKGMAYNKFEDSPKKVMMISSAVSAFIACYLAHLVKSGAGLAEKIGVSMVLGGGLGNLIDRIQHKEVTDFIYVDIKKAPIFNLADIFALAGGIITVIGSYFK